MIGFKLPLFLAVALVLSSSPSWAVERRGGTETDYAELEVIVDQWFAAYGMSDAAAVADIYDADARIMSEGNPSRTGNVGLRARLEKAFATSTTVFESQLEEVEVDRNLGYVVGLYAAKNTKNADGAVKVYGGRFLIILHRVGTGWKVWRDIDNFTPDADPLIAKMKGLPN